MNSLQAHNDRNLDDLVQVLRTGRCVGLVGAGASVACGYPGWDEFLKQLEDLVRDRLAPEWFESLRRQDRRTRADELQRLLGPQFPRIFRATFRHRESCTEPDWIRQLYQLRLWLILTTNYTSELESVADTLDGNPLGRPPRSYRWYVQDDLDEAVRPGDGVRVLHIHGRWDDSAAVRYEGVQPWSEVILGEGSYQYAYEFPGNLGARLADIAAMFTIVVVGASLTDDDVSEVLRRVRARTQAGTHYAILGLRASDDVRATAADLEAQFGLRAVFYPVTLRNGNEDHTELAHLLRDIADRVAPDPYELDTTTPPTFDALFEVVNQPESVPEAVFRTTGRPGRRDLAPYAVPYVPTRGMELRRALHAAGSYLVVEGPSGVGKAREVAELARQMAAEEGWTVCVALNEGDRIMGRPDSLSPKLASSKLLLILDDLHRRIGAEPGALPYPDRLEAMLRFLDERCSGEIAVLATARNEPEYQLRLGYDETRLPWKRFGRYELGDLSDAELVEVLMQMADQRRVSLQRSDAEKLVSDSDRKLSTLYQNVLTAAREDRPLTDESWLPNQGASWAEAFEKARGVYGHAAKVFEALQLVRAAGVRTRYAYVVELSKRLAGGANTKRHVDGLVHLGLLGRRHDILDAFSDEQLVDSLGASAQETPTVAEHWADVIAALTAVDDSQQDLFALADVLGAAGQPDLARDVNGYLFEQLTAAIDRGSTDPKVFYQRSEAGAGLHDWGTVEDDISRAIGLGEDAGEAYYRRAVARVRLHNWKGADDDFTKAIGRGLEDGRVYAGRGLARFARKDWRGADADLTTAVDLGEDASFVFMIRGVARSGFEEWVGSLADLTAALDRDDRRPFVYHRRGVARVELEDWEGAIADLTTAVALGADDASVYVARAKAALALERWESVVEDLTAAMERGREDAQMFSTRALARGHRRNWSGAAADLRLAIDKGETNVDDYLWLGVAHRMLGEYKAARDAYHEGALAHPTEASLWIGLANVEAELGNEPNAARALAEAQQHMGPHDHYTQAMLACGMGEPARALDLLEVAIEEKPERARWAVVDPDLARLRQDPRFAEVTRR